MSEEELTPLLESKICIPAEEKNMISRDSLIQRLEKSEEDVIVFWAGAGFGKTALMAEFARRHSGHCGWYRINELDENPHNFLQGIRLAVSKAMGTNFNVIKTRDLEEDVGELYRKFLSGFLLRLREHVFYICFDDFQTIENECVYKFIESLIEYGRGKIRLMFAVKGDFPRFLAAHLMRQRVLTVCARHMQFDGKETGLLLNKITGKELPGTLVERIHEYTKGWPAGVVFAGIGMKNDGSEDRRPFYFDESYLYDYIFCEIFRKLPADIQKFLAETSVLGEMDAKLCDCALGRSDSEQILEYLARENLFISKQKGRTTKYSYAFVFSDFLSSMLKKERKEQIIYQASEYYAKRGDWDRSFPYAQTYGERQVLQIKCLGQFSVKGPSGSVAFRTRKTRELFACLFFEEGRGVKRDTLMERLWPETDRERASTLFYTTVSYLRRALDKSGVADLLVVENQTYALNLANVNSDLSLLMNWSRYAGAGHIPENANIWEAASIYHDCYMYGEDYIWLGEYREYIEQIFLQTMGNLAEIEMNEGKYKQAVLLLQKAAGVDSYAVFILEALVECLLLAGDIRGAKRQYVKMEKMCKEELGEKPEKSFEDFVKLAKRRRERQNGAQPDC